MIDYGLGTTSTAKYEIRRVDSDYFTEEWIEKIVVRSNNNKAFITSRNVGFIGS